MDSAIHIPALRLGKPYQSMDANELGALGGGGTLASVSQVNAGLIRRDLRNISQSFEALQALSCESLIAISRRAGELFMNEALPAGTDGATQTPQEYVEALSATSGLPHALCRRNMAKINEVFTEMETIVKGLTRGLDPRILDEGIGEQNGVAMSYFPETRSLGAVLPSNSPGVNSIWMPSVALKIPVVLKPGREEPWTPYRIIQAFIAAGCPPEAFSFYPTTHEGANVIMTECGRSIIFGDEKTIARYEGNPAIQVHGPGWSKVIFDTVQAEHWRDHLEVLVDSVCANGGRSCINASAILTPAHGREIAEALAERFASIAPAAPDDDAAVLSAFANPQFAESIDGAIDEGLKTPGATDLTALRREGGRKVEADGKTYLLPTVIFCESAGHPLANREFLFPYTSVIEMPQSDMLEWMGATLVATAITDDAKFIRELLNSKNILRLNIGPLPTSRVQWDQPHEGNLFEFLYTRRAIQRAPVAVSA